MVELGICVKPVGALFGTDSKSGECVPDESGGRRCVVRIAPVGDNPLDLRVDIDKTELAWENCIFDQGVVGLSNDSPGAINVVPYKADAPHRKAYITDRISSVVIAYLLKQGYGAGEGVEVVLSLGHKTEPLHATLSYDMVQCNSWQVRRNDTAARNYLDRTSFEYPLGQNPIPEDDKFGDVGLVREEVYGETAGPVHGSQAHNVKSAMRSLHQAERPSPDEDAILVREVSGRQKLEGLVDTVVQSGLFPKPAGTKDVVVVVGAHPGIMTQALLRHGYRVREVDNQETRGMVGGDPGKVKGVNLTVTKDTTASDVFGLSPLPDICGVFMDVATGETTAVMDTTLNVSLGVRLADAAGCPAVIKARSMPARKGTYGILKTRGHEVRGCETFVSYLPSSLEHLREKYDMWHYARIHIQKYKVRRPSDRPLCATVVFSKPDQDAAGHLYAAAARDVVPPIRTPQVGVYEIMSSVQWFHFIAVRNLVEGEMLSNSPLGRKVLDPEVSDYELVHQIANSVASSKTDQELEIIFDNKLSDSARGVDRGLLQRTPSSVAVLHGRHDLLLDRCVRGQVPRDAALHEVFRHPLSGRMLKDLTALRGNDARLAIEGYSQILPLSHKPILMSKVYFVLVQRYIRIREMFGPSTPHAHEIEYLLWQLSSHGTREDKIAYVLSKMRKSMFNGDSIRGYSRSAGRKAEVVRVWNEVLPVVAGGGDANRAREKVTRLDAALAAAIGQPTSRNVTPRTPRGAPVTRTVVLAHQSTPKRAKQKEVSGLLSPRPPVVNPHGDEVASQPEEVGEGWSDHVVDGRRPSVSVESSVGSADRSSSRATGAGWESTGESLSVFVDESGTAHFTSDEDGSDVHEAWRIKAAAVVHGDVIKQDTENARYTLWLKASGYFGPGISNQRVRKSFSHYLWHPKYIQGKASRTHGVSLEQVRNDDFGTGQYIDEAEEENLGASDYGAHALWTLDGNPLDV